MEIQEVVIRLARLGRIVSPAQPIALKNILLDVKEQAVNAYLQPINEELRQLRSLTGERESQ